MAVCITEGGFLKFWKEVAHHCTTPKFWSDVVKAAACTAAATTARIVVLHIMSPKEAPK